jgi:hypothetical protein
MKYPGLLIGIALLLLFVVACLPAWGAGVTDGESTPGVQPVIVDAAAPAHGPSDPAEVEAFLDEIMPAAIARYNVPGARLSW